MKSLSQCTPVRSNPFAQINTPLFKLAAFGCLPFFLTHGLSAATVGPGSVGSTVTVTSGTTTIVGSTTVTPPANNQGASVSGTGILIADPTAGSMPGSIAINTKGNDAYGVLAESGGQITLKGTAITTVGGTDSYGVYVIDGGSVTLERDANGNPCTITTSATTSAQYAGAGILLRPLSNGSANLTGNGVQIMVDGGTDNNVRAGVAIALANETSPGTGPTNLTLNDCMATVTTDQGTGVYLWSSATATLTGLSLNLTSSDAAGSAIICTSSYHNTPCSLTIGDSTTNGAHSSITTQGTHCIGVLSTIWPGGDTPSTINSTNAIITTAGGQGGTGSVYNAGVYGAVGYMADSGGLVNVNGGSVTTTGKGSAGLQSTDNSNGATGHISHLTAQNMSVATQGDADPTNHTGSYGALCNVGTLLDLTNVIIQTMGTNADGLHCSILDPANSGLSRPNSTLTATGGSIATVGASANGVYVSDNTAIVNVSNCSISTQGMNADGVLSVSHGVANLTNVTVTTTGSSGIGLVVGGATPSTITLTGINSVTTSGTSAHGASMTNGATLNFPTGSTVSAAGSGAADMFMTTGGIIGATQAGVLTVVDSQLSSSSGFGFLVQGGIASINLSNSTVVDCSTCILYRVVSDPVTSVVGNASLVADNGVAMYGNVFADPSNIANLTMTNNSSLTGAATNGGAFVIDPSVWTMTASSDVASLSNAGSIIYTAGGPFKTLTVNGPYTGLAGTISLNTFLGTDGSPSDLLVISGGTETGSTGLTIANKGGPGAATLSDGILVVEAINGGTTAPGSFALTGPVMAGIYEYDLFRGGITPGHDDNWYLRSMGTRAEAPVYSSLPVVGWAVTFLPVSTFHRRQGDQLLLQQRPDQWKAVWVRGFGEHQNKSWKGTVSPSFDGNYFGGQVGWDLWDSGKQSQDNRFRFGVMFSYTRAHGRVKGLVMNKQNANAGTVTLKAPSFGAYLTHLWKGGAYVDTVLQGSYLHGSSRSINNDGIHATGGACTASIEGGIPFKLFSWLTMEPQVQGILQYMSLNKKSDNFSEIKFRKETSYMGRAGFRLYQLKDKYPEKFIPYLLANYWHNFQGTDKIYVDSNVLNVRREANSAEFGAGFAAKIWTHVDAYAQASYLFNLDGEKEHTWYGDLGLRFVW